MAAIHFRKKESWDNHDVHKFLKKFFIFFLRTSGLFPHLPPASKGEKPCSNPKIQFSKSKKLSVMAEIKVFTKEELKGYANGSTKNMGKVTLPSGKYRVERLELREQMIKGADGTEDNRKWVDVHLSGVAKSGVISGSRFATAGFAKEPVKGNTSGNYYFPSVAIGSCYEGDLADMLVDIQGKDIEIVIVEGNTPKFTLKSWKTKEEAKTASAAGWNAKQFMRVSKIHA